jgi:hypothetical protein
MKTDNPLEKVIEKKVCDYAKSKGCIHYKFLSANCRGNKNESSFNGCIHSFCCRCCSEIQDSCCYIV